MTEYIEPKIESYSDTLHRLFPEEFKNSNAILTLTFQVTEDCCMACTYCYQNNKSKNTMSFEVSKQIIDNLLTSDEYYNTYNVKAIILEFIGGEPLLEIDLIQQTVDYFIVKAAELNHRFLNRFMISLSSNGLLYFDEKVQKFIKKYSNRLSYGISIDGNKKLHDSCRIDLEGKGTYDRVIKAAQYHQQHYVKDYGTKMTISPYNINYLFDAIIDLINNGYISISLNCIFEEGWNISHAQILYKELKKVADWLFENDAFKKYHISIFDEELFQPMDDNDTNNWCGGICNGMLAFDHQGRAYPCIRYMNSSLNNKQPPLIIGATDGLFRTQEEKENYNLLKSITRQSQSTEECLSCPVAKGCAWCSGYNYEQFGTPNKRATYICWMHKARSLANAYYYNKGYYLLQKSNRIKIYLPYEDALQIISPEEWQVLKYFEEKNYV